MVAQLGTLGGIATFPAFLRTDLTVFNVRGLLSSGIDDASLFCAVAAN
jgi:hypothetical protein